MFKQCTVIVIINLESMNFFALKNVLFIGPLFFRFTQVYDTKKDNSFLHTLRVGQQLNFYKQ